MSSARRPLLTAAAAGGLLCALWFVPSANATPEVTVADTAAAAGPSSQAVGRTGVTATSLSTTGEETARLADTGSFDSTPYVIGGAVCLGLGAGFVAYSVRRERLDF